MYPDPAITPAEYMRHIVEMFCVTMPREACHIRFGALSCALWGRVRKLAARFCGLYSLWKAGRLPVAPLRSSASSARAWMAWSAATGKTGQPEEDVGARVRVRAAYAARSELPAAGDRVRRAGVPAAAEGLPAAQG